MRYQVSRFETIDGKLQPTQPIGLLYETREEAEKKLAETRKTFEVFARHYRFDICEIPDKPKEPEPPLATNVIVTEKFREGPGHPFSLFINYRCPICDQFHRIALDGVFGSGNRIFRCECGEKVTLHLQFDIPEVQDKPQVPEAKADWLRFWNPKVAKH